MVMSISNGKEGQGHVEVLPQAAEAAQMALMI
jgi:hypothetical protein